MTYDARRSRVAARPGTLTTSLNQGTLQALEFGRSSCISTACSMALRGHAQDPN